MEQTTQDRKIQSGSIRRRGHIIGIVSILTMIVAVFGYLREATLAAHFGVSATMDAYFGAIFIPNIVYLVLIAGTLSPILIPILLDNGADDECNKASEAFSVITNFVLLLLIIIIACGMITARNWLTLLFPGFGTGTTGIAVHLVYIIFPGMLFLAVAGILTAVLNGFHRFSLATFAPALSSLAVISGVFVARGDRSIYIIGIATAIGFLLQCLLLTPAVASLGIRYRLILNLRHPAIRKLLQLGIPLFLYLATANASSFLERNLASRLSAGAVSTVTYAMRLFTVPANFLAAPLAIVTYPQFAREAARENRGELRNQVSQVFRLVIFVFVPVTTWTILNAIPVTRLLYERGQFSLQDSLAVARVLQLYSLGILPYAIGVIMLRCFWAVQDTVTPLLVELIDLVFYVVVAIVMTKHFGIQGLAFTRGMTFYLVGLILVFVAWKVHLLRIGLEFFSFLARTVLSSAVMATVSWLSFRLLQPLFDSGNSVFRLAIICILLVECGATFLAAARLLRIGEAAHVINTAQSFILGSFNKDKTF